MSGESRIFSGFCHEETSFSADKAKKADGDAGLARRRGGEAKKAEGDAGLSRERGGEAKKAEGDAGLARRRGGEETGRNWKSNSNAGTRDFRYESRP